MMGNLGKSKKNRKHKSASDDIGVLKKRDFNGHDKKTINMCPENDDVQEMPRKVKGLMKWQETGRQKPSSSRKRKKHNQHEQMQFKMERGMTRPLEPVPVFKKSKQETSEEFMRRVERKTYEVLQASQIEDKFKVKLHENGQGKHIPEKKKKSERKREKDKERKKLKVQKAREKRNDKKPDFSHLKDKIRFGEVAMAPPTLTAKPKKSEERGVGKAKTQSLLLTQMLSGAASNTAGSLKKTFGVGTRSVGQTVKRKHLSPAQQRITDKQRQDAIDKYRTLKGKQTLPTKLPDR